MNSSRVPAPTIHDLIRPLRRMVGAELASALGGARGPKTVSQS